MEEAMRELHEGIWETGEARQVRRRLSRTELEVVRKSDGRLLTVLCEFGGDLQPFLIAAVWQPQEDASADPSHETEDRVVRLNNNPIPCHYRQLKELSH